MKRITVISLTVLFFLGGALTAQTKKPQGKNSKRAEAKAETSSPDFDPQRLARLNERMKSFVDRGRTSGMVTLLAHQGKIVQQSALGFQDLESRKPMTENTIFQIASMTKPITCVGIMILAEEGLLSITDPVEKFLPGFAKLQIREKAEGDVEEIRKPKRKITLRDLMTHTSGMSSGYPEEFKDLFTKRDHTLAEAVEAFPTRFLDFEPGTKWGYSNMGIATLGRIIEIVSGKGYDEFLTERIFKPLGMNDSHFFVPEGKRDRIATIYKLENGKLVKADVDLYRQGAKYPAPEAGLYSTAPDLFQFYQMMLNGGMLDGKRILSKFSVEVMTANQTGNLTAGFSPGVGYGLGWSVVRNPEGMFRLNSIGTFGHGGLWKTYGWVDPKKELVGLILMQRLSDDGDLADEFNAFMTMAAVAMN
ncbi:MAG: beta-lactamase family protein [Acidobacteria bacterium]|nr:beta-lactamase family protein [Acidobacteriota bacterium]